MRFYDCDHDRGSVNLIEAIPHRGFSLNFLRYFKNNKRGAEGWVLDLPSGAKEGRLTE